MLRCVEGCGIGLAQAKYLASFHESHPLTAPTLISQHLIKLNTIPNGSNVKFNHEVCDFTSV